MSDIKYSLNNNSKLFKELNYPNIEKYKTQVGKVRKLNEIIIYDNFNIVLEDFVIFSIEQNHFGRMLSTRGEVNLRVIDFSVETFELKISFSIEENKFDSELFEKIFTFNNTNNKPLILQSQDISVDRKEKFELFLINLIDALFKYALDNNASKNILKSIRKEISSDLLLMVFSNINQQVIQNSFRDIDTSEQNDMKFKTTAKGLEESLSNIVLPKGDGLAIQNVELNDAFRISYTEATKTI